MHPHPVPGLAARTTLPALPVLPFMAAHRARATHASRPATQEAGRCRST